MHYKMIIILICCLLSLTVQAQIPIVSSSSLLEVTGAADEVCVLMLEWKIEQSRTDQGQKEANQRQKVKKRELAIKNEYGYDETKKYNWRAFTGKKRRWFNKLVRERIKLAKIEVTRSNIIDVDILLVSITLRKKTVKSPISEKELLVWTIVDVDTPSDFERINQDAVSRYFITKLNNDSPFSSSVEVVVDLKKGSGKSASMSWKFGVETNPEEPSRVNLEYLPTEDYRVLKPLDGKVGERNVFYSTNLIKIRADFLQEANAQLNPSS